MIVFMGMVQREVYTETMSSVTKHVRHRLHDFPDHSAYTSGRIHVDINGHRHGTAKSRPSLREGRYVRFCSADSGTLVHTLASVLVSCDQQLAGRASSVCSDA